MGDTTYHAMAFAEADIDNHGRFEPLAADMMPYGSGADIDAGPGDRRCRRTPTTRNGPDIRQFPPGAGQRVEVLEASSSAFARSGRPPAMIRLQAARAERSPPHGLIRA